MTNTYRRWILSLLLALVLLLIICGESQFVVLSVVLLVPPLLFFRWIYRQQPQYGITDQEVKQLFYCFLAGVFPTPVLAMLAQTLMLPLWILLCFYDQRDSLLSQLHHLLEIGASASGSGAAGSGSMVGSPQVTRLADLLQQLDVKHTFGFYFFLFAMSFVVAGVIEEYLKYWIVQGRCCCVRRLWSCCCCQSNRPHGLCHPTQLLYQRRKHQNHWVVVYLAVVAGALGFSFAENIGYTHAAPTYHERLVTATARGLLSTSLHGVCGGITGVRMAKWVSTTATRSVSLAAWRTKVSVLWPAIVVHGLFDLQIFLLSVAVPEQTAKENGLLYTVLVPAALAIVTLSAAMVYMRRSYRALQQQMEAKGVYVQVATDLEAGERPSDEEDDFEDHDDGQRSPRSTVLMV